MINAYQTDVTARSDEDLKALSAEIEEAYRYSDPEGDYDWYLSEEAQSAERRHREMQAEIYRRWALANPVEAQRREEERKRYAANPSLLVGDVLKALQANLSIVAAVSREFDNEFTRKVGNSISVRKPTRFTV